MPRAWTSDIPFNAPGLVFRGGGPAPGGPRGRGFLCLAVISILCIGGYIFLGDVAKHLETARTKSVSAVREVTRVGAAVGEIPSRLKRSAVDFVGAEPTGNRNQHLAVDFDARAASNAGFDSRMEGSATSEETRKVFIDAFRSGTVEMK